MRDSRVDGWEILQIAAAWSGTQLVLRVSGELDLCSARCLGQALDEAAARAPTRVLLDLERVSFIDVAGIRAILRGAEIFGSRLVLHRTPPHVMRLFTIIGVEQRLTFGRDSNAG
jgi:anti-sigma B factor antagonist